MYDGIKIECKVTDSRKWETALALVGRHAVNTGEILPMPAEASSHGLTFCRIPTPLGAKYTIQGSIHRYHNKGAENDNDFTLSDVRKTIHNLEDNYGISALRSKVLNFEFGVNINLPSGMDSQNFQKYLVSAYTKAFEKLNPRRPMVGYIAEFNEFSIKIYDKGYQARTGATDQLRVEIRVTRPRWLDQFGFKKGKDLYLTDLLNPENIKILGNILENKVRSLILTPRDIDLSKLTNKQKLTFYECRDARSWEDWNSRQRDRKRDQLNNIFKKVGQRNPVDVLADLVVNEWNKLSTDPNKPTGQNIKKKVTLSTIIVSGIRAFLDLFKKHVNKKTNTNKSFISYLPRGIPVKRVAPVLQTSEGYNRWIDLTTRSPDEQNKCDLIFCRVIISPAELKTVYHAK